MHRVLRLASVVALVVTSGLTAAQVPTPSPVPTQPSPPTQPPNPNPVPVQPPTTPTPTDPTQAIPVGQSTWKSQDGSIVDITIDPTTGALTGTFAPSFACGPSAASPSSPGPVVGTVSANAVAWTLSLPECPSVGTWVGHYQTVDTVEQLAMLWTLAVPESPPGVGSTLTGSALFVRQVVQ